MPIKSLKIRAYVHATENKDKVMKAIENIIGTNLLEKAELEEDLSNGHYGNPILIIRITLKGKNAIEAFNRIIMRLAKTDRMILKGTLEERVDRNGTLFFRLSKQDAFRGDLLLYESDDVIHIAVSFQGRRKKAVEEFSKRLEEDESRKDE